MLLTVAEVAALKGCSQQYIKKLCKDGKLEAELATNSNNRPQYRIPLDSLPCELQTKYYKRLDFPLPVELQKPKPKKAAETKIYDFDQLKPEQRKLSQLWVRIIKDWLEFCDWYDGSKAEATQAFVEQADYGVHISDKILYRKWQKFKAGDISGLCDMRGYVRKGHTAMCEDVWQAILYYYLDESRMSLSYSIYLATEWVKQEHPELESQIPTYANVYRRMTQEVNDGVKVLGREGEKAYRDKYGFYIRREYDTMYSNQYWIADNHTFDVFVKGDNNKPIRVYLTAFMDCLSGVLTGVYVTTNPSSQATIYALQRGIRKYGIPEYVYVDNGREFLNTDVGGLGHRQKKSTKDEFVAPPIFARLGITMINAQVRNARAKTIERRFKDVKEHISKLFKTYTGGNVLEKPERLKKILKGDYIDEREFTALVEDIIEYHFNYELYGGAKASERGKTRMQVYKDNFIKQARPADEQSLWLMMLRSTRLQKVKARGVYVTVCGQKIDFYSDELLLEHMSESVYVRYDPCDLSEVRVYDTDDRYLCTAKCGSDTVLKYGSSKDVVSRAVKEVRHHEKMAKDKLKSSKIVALGAKTALDVIIAEVEERKATVDDSITAPVIELRRADEELEYNDIAVGEETRPVVDIQRMIKNAEKRKDDY